MIGDGNLLTVEMVPLREIVETLRGTHPFAESSAETLLETLAEAGAFWWRLQS